MLSKVLHVRYPKPCTAHSALNAFSQMIGSIPVLSAFPFALIFVFLYGRLLSNCGPSCPVACHVSSPFFKESKLKVVGIYIQPCGLLIHQNIATTKFMYCADQKLIGFSTISLTTCDMEKLCRGRWINNDI